MELQLYADFNHVQKPTTFNVTPNHLTTGEESPGFCYHSEAPQTYLQTFFPMITDYFLEQVLNT